MGWGTLLSAPLDPSWRLCRDRIRLKSTGRNVGAVRGRDLSQRSMYPRTRLSARMPDRPHVRTHFFADYSGKGFCPDLGKDLNLFPFRCKKHEGAWMGDGSSIWDVADLPRKTFQEHPRIWHAGAPPSPKLPLLTGPAAPDFSGIAVGFDGPVTRKPYNQLCPSTGRAGSLVR